MIGLMGVNLFLCTIRRRKALSWSILILHIGIISTLIGSVVSSFGFVSTVNIYEGTTQLQVLAAMGGVIGGGVSERLNEYEEDNDFSAVSEIFQQVRKRVREKGSANS